MRRTSSAAVCLAVLASAARGQFAEPGVRVIYTFQGAPGSGLGWVVSPLRDLDGDGKAELIIPSPGAGGNTGHIDVYSGGTGLPIPYLSLDGAVPAGRFGHAIADAGDVDHDGTADVIVGSPGPGTTAGRIYIYSGRTGALIRRVDGQAVGDGFGFSVAGVGDLNGDGYAEVIVGAPGFDGNGSGAGRVYILSGIDGSILRFHDGEAAGDRLGSGVSAIGDANGDGIPEYAAAGTGGGPLHHGRAYLWSGATGAALVPAMDADTTGSQFGQFFVGGPGDADRDGVPDLYVGDYADSKVYLFSGRTGARVRVIAGAAAEGLGCGRGAGDINGDGYADLAVGAYSSSAGAAQAGRVYLYSGLDGSVLRTITSTRAGEQFGFDAIGVGDLDGDGRPDVLVGASTGNRAYVIAGVHLPCYANCDSSTQDPVLNINDFVCFLNRFAAGAAYANCDGSTAPPTLNVNDFVCYANRYAQGCP